MSDLLRIGNSALHAAYTQLQTTGQNISNVNTPGYVRREAQLQEAGNADAGGWSGRGVDVVAVRRAYDQFLVRESVLMQSTASQDKARAGALSRLENLFSDPDTGLGAAYDNLIGAFTDVTARPSDLAARSTVLSRAEAFASRVVSLDGQVQSLRQSAQSNMQSEVTKANETLSALARLNARIADAQGNSGPANGLLDQRDLLLQNLNASVRANAVIGQDGTVTLTSNRGELLLVGAQASSLSLRADTLDSNRMTLEVKQGNGATTTLEASEAGGALAGLLKFANEDIDSVRAQIGRMYAAVASAFNDRQARGLDATGAAGQAMFALGAPRVTGTSANTGTAELAASIADAKSLAASDYQVIYSNGEYRFTRVSDGTVSQFSSLPASLDGLSLSLTSGTPAEGDRFLVRAGTQYASGAKSLLTNPQRLATALPVAAQLGAANGGDLKISALDVTTQGTNTGASVTITFGAGNTFSVSGTGTGNPTGLTYTPGMTLSYNGWSLTLTGSPSAGDTVQLAATANPLVDNRNARAMQSLGTERFVDGATAIDRYAELIGDLGARAQSAQSASEMNQRLFDDVQRSRSEVSGVNLDEEAARLMQYQQAYQAAAKMIAAANELFRTLMDVAR